MANKNCLNGLCCPFCKGEGPFWIAAILAGHVLMSDNGTLEEKIDSTEWNNESAIRCYECDYEGAVSDFTC